MHFKWHEIKGMALRDDMSEKRKDSQLFDVFTR